MLRYSISDRALLAASNPTSPATEPTPASAPTADPLLGGPASEPPLPPGFAPLLAQAHRLAAAGVDVFLLREPDLPACDLARLARAILAAFRTQRAPTRLLLHSRADIAVATGAHGVHLPSRPGQLHPSQVRELYRLAGLPAPIVSLSCHTLDDIRRATLLQPAPDLLLFGPVFEKRVHGTPVLPGTGLALLGQACRLAAPIPVLALGGITPQNSPACLEAGAAGIAAIRLFAAPNPFPGPQSP